MLHSLHICWTHQWLLTTFFVRIDPQKKKREERFFFQNEKKKLKRAVRKNNRRTERSTDEPTFNGSWLYQKSFVDNLWTSSDLLFYACCHMYFSVSRFNNVIKKKQGYRTTPYVRCTYGRVVNSPYDRTCGAVSLKKNVDQTQETLSNKN